MSDGESDGTVSYASWVGLASDSSSDSDPDIIFRCFSLTLLIIGQTLVLLFNFCLAISFIVRYCVAIYSSLAVS